METLSREDILDILYGCSVLGTGGGGRLEEGIHLVDRALAAGGSFRLAALDELADDDWVGTPYMCGAISPQSEEDLAKYAHLPDDPDRMCILAAETLEAYLGHRFKAFISTELGGANTAEAMCAAALCDRLIVDADPAGRSVPELQHSTYYIHGLPIAPLAVANAFGETAVISKIVNDFRAEALVRALAVQSRNSIGVCDHPCQVRDLREAVIPRAISYARAIGRALRQSQADKSDTALAVAEAGKGRILLRGLVSRYDWSTEGGFTVGTVTVEGRDADRGRTLVLQFQNEFMYATLDGKIVVSVPDLICLLRDDSGEAVSNPYYEEGMPVTCFILPSADIWRSPAALKIFGPKSIGLDIEYQAYI